MWIDDVIGVRWKGGKLRQKFAIVLTGPSAQVWDTLVQEGLSSADVLTGQSLSLLVLDRMSQPATLHNW